MSTVLAKFYIEQGLLAAWSLGMLTLFAVQYERASRAKSVLSVSIKLQFNLIGVLACMLFCVMSVDPYGIHGIYGSIVTPWLMGNVTSLLVTAAVVLNKVSMEVYIRSELRDSGVAISVVSWLLVVLTFVICNTGYILASALHKWYYTGFFLMWVAVVIFVVVLSFVGFTLRILHVLKKAEVHTRTIQSRDPRDRSNSEVQADRRNKTLFWKAMAVFVIGMTFVPVQFASAFKRYNDKDATEYSPDLERFSLNDRIFLYFQVLAVLVIKWYSWVPPPPKQDYFTVSSSESFPSSRPIGNDRDRDMEWKTAGVRRVLSTSDKMLQQYEHSDRPVRRDRLSVNDDVRQ